MPDGKMPEPTLEDFEGYLSVIWMTAHHQEEADEAKEIQKWVTHFRKEKQRVWDLPNHGQLPRIEP